MQTYLSKYWHQFSAEVWERLFDFERYGMVTISELPDDLYIELARPAYENWLNFERGRLEEKINQVDNAIVAQIAGPQWADVDENFAVYDDMEIEELQSIREEIKKEFDNLEDNDILTNPGSARKFLRDWHKQYNIQEEQAANMIVQWYETLKDICSGYDQFITEYIKLVRSFLENRNLRYLLLEDNGNIRLVFNPAVLFMEKIILLKNKCHADPRLKIYYKDFENDICNLISDLSDSRKRSVLRVSSNLLEGSAKHSINRNGRSLSEIINNAPDNIFPHPSVKDAILSVYKFFCDYIGGRHSGNTSSRGLEEKDAILFGSISALFSEYLLNNN